MMINLWVVLVVLVSAVGIFLVFNEVILKKKNKSSLYLAEIYGLRPGVHSKGGIEFRDLVYLKEDKLRKVEYPDKTVYELLGSGKTTPAVEVDSMDKVTRNGKIVRRVRVLVEGDSCTLLKASYSKKAGDMMFKPVPYDTMTSISNDMYVKGRRYKTKADIWAKITPIISILLSIITVIAVVVIQGNTMVKVAKENSLAAQEMGGIVERSIEDIVLASVISSGFTKEDMNSLKEQIQEIKDLKEDSKKSLGNQNIYKGNQSNNISRV